MYSTSICIQEEKSRFRQEQAAAEAIAAQWQAHVSGTAKARKKNVRALQQGLPIDEPDTDVAKDAVAKPAASADRTRAR